MYLRHATVFGFCLLMTLLLQWRGNAYNAEWSEDSDEPAHYVTGLMVRDYVASGLRGSPMAFGQQFYEHYPKVAIGHWPPVFYLLQAGWMLVFGVSRASLLTLMATLGAAWLTLCYAVVRLCFPFWMAAATVVMLACTPQYQSSTRMVMAEIVVAIFALLALRFLARYLDRGASDHRDVWRFAAASLATVLTKGTGIALAPMPLLGIVASRKSRLLRSVHLWLPAILAAALAAVWFLAAPDALQDKVTRFGRFGLLRWYRIGETFEWWMVSLGLLGSALAVSGFLRKAWSIARGRESEGLWIVAVLFIPVTLACRTLFGPWELRHLLTTLPLLMLFLWHGLEGLLAKFVSHRKMVTAAILFALALTPALAVARMPAKPHLGLDRVARDLASAPEYAQSRFLIVSDSNGEGVFIAEVASREKRPGHFIERGTKVLGETSWMGDRTRMFFDTPEDLLSFFEKHPDWIVVLDGVGAEKPWLVQMREVIRRFPQRWRLLASYPRTSGTMPISVFRIQL
jgi:4-amino-4-deoxy-L-arabinose transferase-like glycosyltransferase